FAVAAMTIGAVRFRRDLADRSKAATETTEHREKKNSVIAVPSVVDRPPGGIARGIRDALTLRHWHDAGDCTEAEESRAPWRRRFHHVTFYGFALCFASTTVAAFYHIVMDWRAPYALTSVPVVLGTVGGLGLIAGPLGLLRLTSGRDPDLGTDIQRRLD